MIKFIFNRKPAFVWSSILLCCFSFSNQADSNQAEPVKPGSVLISAVTVIDIKTGKKQKQDIIIEGEKIVDVREHHAGLAPQGRKVVDGSGLYAIPGLWDMHIHLTMLPELEDRLPSLLIANGVTSVRDLGGELDKILAYRKAAEENGKLMPRIKIAGPLLDGSPRIFDGIGIKPAMSTALNTEAEAIDYVDLLAAKGVDVIKTYEMLRPEVFAAIVKRAHHYNLPVTGHIPNRMTIPQAISAGMDSIEHLAGIKYACSQDPDGLLAERVAILDNSPEQIGRNVLKKVRATVGRKALAAQDPSRCHHLINMFARKKVWHSATLAHNLIPPFNDSVYNKAYWLEAMMYLPKSMQEKGLKQLSRMEKEFNQQEYDWYKSIVSQMHQAGVQFLTGTDSPPIVAMAPGFSVHGELKSMVIGGVSPLAALQSATINPAKFFNIADTLGSIEAGKYADLILLTADPLQDISNTRKINTVISRGQLVDRAELDTMLEQMLKY